MIRKGYRRALFFTACLVIGLAVSMTAQAQTAPIAGGKTITMIIAYGTGGGYDIYGRLVARHLGKHLPGTPTVVVKNMPGAGGLVAANSLYNISPKDGSELGVVSQNVALAQLIDKESVKYDARAFTWIGRATSSVETFYAWHTAKLQSIEDAKKKAEELAKTMADKFGIDWTWKGDTIAFDAPKGAAGIDGRDRSISTLT